jgi:hypothetical protein
MIIGVLTSDHTTYHHLQLNNEHSTLQIICIITLILSLIIVISNLSIETKDVFQMKITKQNQHWGIKVIVSAISILTIFILFFMKNEINQSIIEMCSHEIDICIYLIIYSIFISSTILIQNSKISTALIALIFIILQIMLHKSTLLSPFYHIFGSYFTLILDTQHGLYFYQPKLKSNNFSVGSNVILNIQTNGNEIKSIDCSIKLSAYDINGRLTNTDGRGYIRFLKKQNITNGDKINQVIDSLLMNISYLNDLNYDQIDEMEKSGKILPTEQITDIFEIHKNPILQISLGNQISLSTIIQILKAKSNDIIDKANNNEYYKASFSQGNEEGFSKFILNQILSKLSLEQNIPIEQLAILMNNLPHLIYRIPLHIKQIYGDKRNTWKEISFSISSNIIDIYIYLRNLTIKPEHFIKHDNWKKF